MEAKKRSRFVLILLILLAVSGSLITGMDSIVNQLVVLAMSLGVIRVFFVPHHWPIVNGVLQLTFLILVTLLLPGLWSAAILISASTWFLSSYQPTQVRPREVLLQSVIPYLAVSLAIMKSILQFTDLDFSILSAQSVTEQFSGVLGIVVCTIQLSYLIQKREQVYEGLLKTMAVNEKNWTLELMSLLSHNIRTPIAAISNRVEIIKMKHELGKDITTEDLESLDESNKSVGSIVNELLSKTAKTLLMDKEGIISLDAALNAMELDKVGYENEESIDFNLASTNAIALQLCIDSVLSNAFKYGNGEVKLVVGQDSANYTIAIKDNGFGMSTEQIEMYGTPFNNKQTKGGTGLGIYFTLQLIKEKGWDWKLDSTMGKGTTVTLIIPKEKLLL